MSLADGRDTILSGFSLIPTIYAGGLWDNRAQAINNLCNLLASRMYRYFAWATPIETLPIFGSKKFDAPMPCNTIIWGFMATPKTTGSESATFKLTLPDGSYFTNNDFFPLGAMQDTTGPIYTSSTGITSSRLPYFLLPEPIFVPSGHVEITLSNSLSVAVTAQLILLTARPIDVVKGTLEKYCSVSGPACENEGGRP